MLHDELQYFIDHQEELLQLYGHRVLVIKDRQVVGDYETPLQAFLEAKQVHALGTFLIQRCEPGRDAYTVTLSTHGLIQ